MIDLKVKNALKQSLRAYSEQTDNTETDLVQQLVPIFESDAVFLEKIDKIDAAFDEYPDFEEMREYIFDLLMINFFSEDVAKLEEDYLESEAWETIEDQTIDRGSELLNVLLYLGECDDEEIEPSLEDYLKEFLLVEEDEFQDEYSIYEKVIANQVLIESPYSEISKTSSELDTDDELKDLFYPLISYFSDIEPNQQSINEYIEVAKNPPLDAALLSLLISFK